MPEMSFNTFPGLAGPATIRRVLPKHAAYMILTSRRVDAATAERWGIVNSVVPHDQLLDEAEKLARHVAQFDAVALDWAKKGYPRPGLDAVVGGVGLRRLHRDPRPPGQMAAEPRVATRPSSVPGPAKPNPGQGANVLQKLRQGALKKVRVGGVEAPVKDLRGIRIADFGTITAGANASQMWPTSARTSSRWSPPATRTPRAWQTNAPAHDAEKVNPDPWNSPRILSTWSTAISAASAWTSSTRAVTSWRPCGWSVSSDGLVRENYPTWCHGSSRRRLCRGIGWVNPSILDDLDWQPGVQRAREAELRIVRCDPGRASGLMSITGDADDRDPLVRARKSTTPIRWPRPSARGC